MQRLKVGIDYKHTIQDRDCINETADVICSKARVHDRGDYTIPVYW